MNLGKIELIRSEAVLLTCFNGGGGTACRYCVRGGGDRGKTRFPTASQPANQTTTTTRDAVFGLVKNLEADWANKREPDTTKITSSHLEQFL